MAECLIVKSMHGYVSQCEDDEVRPAITNPAFTSVDPALYGGLPDAADPDEVRKHKQRGAREEDAAKAAKAAPRWREIPLCVGNCR
jgi:hypothetical protein